MSKLSDSLKSLRKKHGLTQAELATALGMSKSVISMYESGQRLPSFEVLESLADFYNVSLSALRGEFVPSSPIPNGFEPLPQMDNVPLVGQIACGTPILAEENIEDTVSVPSQWHADFTLICKGDSMSPTVQDGDLVAIRMQPEVANGEIAAVRIENEATLKRVYIHAEYIELRPENPDYPSIIRRRLEMNDVHIEGKAVGICRGL